MTSDFIEEDTCRTSPARSGVISTPDEEESRESVLKKALADDISSLAALPRKNGELVFQNPWESRAFGIAVALCENGLYDWNEFRDGLISHIQEWEENPEAKGEWDYYKHWVSSLENMLNEKGVASLEEISRKVTSVEAAWKHEEEHHSKQD